MECPLFDEPLPLIAYVSGALGCYLAFVGIEIAWTPVTSGDVTLFAALMCCGALCVEATRRLGQPTGVWRDLLSAWWLPVALLLPPLYALDDVTAAFTTVGFAAAVSRLKVGFIPASRDHAPSFPAGLDYFYEHKVMLRFTKLA